MPSPCFEFYCSLCPYEGTDGLQWNSKQRCHCTNHSDEHPASSTGFRILCGDAKDMVAVLLCCCSCRGSPPTAHQFCCDPWLVSDISPSEGTIIKRGGGTVLNHSDRIAVLSEGSVRSVLSDWFRTIQIHSERTVKLHKMNLLNGLSSQNKFTCMWIMWF